MIKIIFVLIRLFQNIPRRYHVINNIRNNTIFPITITGIAGLKIFPIHVFSVINDIRKYVPLILIHIFFTVLQKF